MSAAAVYKISPDALQDFRASIEPVAKALASIGRNLPIFGNMLQGVEASSEGISSFMRGERKAGLSKIVEGVAQFAGFDVGTLSTAVQEVRDAIKHRSGVAISAAVLAGAGEVAVGAVFGQMAGAMARDAVRLQTSQFAGELFAPSASSLTQMREDVLAVKRDVKTAVDQRRQSKPPTIKM